MRIKHNLLRKDLPKQRIFYYTSAKESHFNRYRFDKTRDTNFTNKTYDFGKFLCEIGLLRGTMHGLFSIKDVNKIFNEN